MVQKNSKASSQPIAPFPALADEEMSSDESVHVSSNKTTKESDVEQNFYEFSEREVDKVKPETKQVVKHFSDNDNKKEAPDKEDLEKAIKKIDEPEETLGKQLATLGKQLATMTDRKVKTYDQIDLEKIPIVASAVSPRSRVAKKEVSEKIENWNRHKKNIIKGIDWESEEELDKTVDTGKKEKHFPKRHDEETENWKRLVAKESVRKQNFPDLMDRFENFGIQSVGQGKEKILMKSRVKELTSPLYDEIVTWNGEETGIEQQEVMRQMNILENRRQHIMDFSKEHGLATIPYQIGDDFERESDLDLDVQQRKLSEKEKQEKFNEVKIREMNESASQKIPHHGERINKRRIQTRSPHDGFVDVPRYIAGTGIYVPVSVRIYYPSNKLGVHPSDNCRIKRFWRHAP